MQHLLRPAEVARVLGVSRTWLYDAAKSGRIPSIRIGGPDGPLRFVEEDIDRWLEEARAAWRPGDSSAATLRRTVDQVA
jgi:excisionase family DNA binding protein